MCGVIYKALFVIYCDILALLNKVTSHNDFLVFIVGLNMFFQI